MDTLSQMRNDILKLYISAVKQFPDKDEEFYEWVNYVAEEDDTQEKFDIQTFRIQYIIDNITLMSKSEEFDLLSLLAFYYYIFTAPNKNIINELGDLVNEDYKVDPILYLIENEDIDVIIDGLRTLRTGYLYDILHVIIEEDISNYDLELYEDKEIDDFDEFVRMEQVINDEKFVDVFKKLHPNIEKERLSYIEYKTNENYLLKFSKLEVKSLSMFIQLFIILKQKLTTKLYLKETLTQILNNMSENNSELYNEIAIYILKYCYIKSYLYNKENFKEIKKAILVNIHRISEIDEYFIEMFLDYDLTNHIYDFNSLKEEELKTMESIVSINNTKTYGIDGVWKKYTLTDKESLIKYVPSWQFDEGKEQYIYYSTDENGNFIIPRLCLEVIDNKIVNIIGRGYNHNIEFELIDILKEKILYFNNYQEIKSKLDIIEKIKTIEKKIKNGVELELGEIDILYEINYKLDDLLFSSYDFKLTSLREFSNTKKDLARYFGCKEEEVATDASMLNENTIVTTFFYPLEHTCYYPKLRVIFCDAWADYLTSAKGLSSLEYIKGAAMFEQLTSSEGLQNLVRIDEDAFFNNMEDFSYINSKLVIKGSVKLKEGFEPKVFEL